MMITIEERAKEYVGAPCDDGCAICDAPLCMLNEYLAFIDGARSEHDELTRWHDPKEELPEPHKYVLTKHEEGDYVLDFYEPDRWGFHFEQITKAKVIGWREIHE